MRDYISFPGIFKEPFYINKELFNISGFPIYWYGVIISIAVFISLFLALKNSYKYEIEDEDIIDIMLIVTPISIIGARVFYVVFSMKEYNSIVDIFNIRQGGMSIIGGLIFGISASVFAAKRRNIKVVEFLDFAVPYLALAQAIGRWGNFFNQESFGSTCTLPWGMSGTIIRAQLSYMKDKGFSIDPSLPVHPTFLYESILTFCIFIILIIFRRSNKVKGEIFLMYIVLYGFGRFIIEGFRLDSLMLGNFRISRWIALISAIIALILLIYRRNSQKYEAENIRIGKTKYSDVFKSPNMKDSRHSNINSFDDEDWK